MSELFDAYVHTRARMIAVVRATEPSELATTVPACPDWAASDLIAHCVSMPAAIGAGDLPTGSIDDWLRGLIEARRGRPIDETIDEWLAVDDTIASMLDGPGAVLFGDLAVHEHDLRGALLAPDHDALEVELVLPRTLAAFATPLRDAGLGSIVVRHQGEEWRSHDAEPGLVLEVCPWEAVRIVNSRRTADELRALPRTTDAATDIGRYIIVFDEHLPLPSTSLGEI
jgi:hypothetical protein